MQLVRFCKYFLFEEGYKFRKVVRTIRTIIGDFGLAKRHLMSFQEFAESHTFSIHFITTLRAITLKKMSEVYLSDQLIAGDC